MPEMSVYSFSTLKSTSVNSEDACFQPLPMKRNIKLLQKLVLEVSKKKKEKKRREKKRKEKKRKEKKSHKKALKMISNCI